MSPPKYNWEAIEMDWCAGILPISAICAKYGVGQSILSSRAAKMNWVRREPPEEAVVQGIAAISAPSSPKDPDDPLHFSEDELRKYAAITASTILNCHRKDLARLRGISAQLIDRLGLILEGKRPVDAQGNELPTLGSRESPADLLEKLSRVTMRYVQMERENFGLNTLSANPGSDDPEEEGKVMSELDKMIERLEAASASKSALASEDDLTQASDVHVEPTRPKKK